MNAPFTGSDVVEVTGRLDSRLRAFIAPAQWTALWRALGTSEPPQSVYWELIRRYAEPHRAYHGLQHLAECLEVRRRLGTPTETTAEIDVALWFHDAIYDPVAHDNEVQSAQWLNEVARGVGMDEIARRRLCALVLVTRHDAAPASVDESVVVDTDLAILGTLPARFDEYDRQIRAEYGHVPGFLYRRKRRQVLQVFHDRNRIYATERYFNSLEKQARANLSRAIHALS